MNLCVTCGEDFGSVQAFDRHRVGKHEYTFAEGLRREPSVEDGRRCLDIEEMETAEKDGALIFARNARGSWSLSGSLVHIRERRNRESSEAREVSS